MGKSTTYTTLQTTKWRALTYDWTELSASYGDNECLICLTDFERAWLQSNVDYFRWKTRWTNLTVSSNELLERADALEAKLMSCSDLQPYQLDYVYNQQVSDALQAYKDAYDLGGIAGLNPNTPIDFYNGDASQDRNDALCTALKIYCYTYAANWATNAQIILGVSVGAALGALLIPFGGIIAITILAGGAYYAITALQAMSDTTALDNVVCCMRDHLEGLAVTQVNWENSLDACAFTVGSNEEIIAGIIGADLNIETNWLSFLNNLGDSYVLAQNGVSDCPCAGTWEHTFDFTVSDGGWVENNFLNDVGAVWLAGIGWSYKDATFASNDHRRASAIKRTFTDVTVTECEFVYDLTKGTVNIPGATAMANNLLDNGVVQGFSIKTFAAIVTGNDQIQNVTFTTNCDEIRLIASSCARTPAAWDGDVVIKSVTVKGTGISPF